MKYLLLRPNCFINICNCRWEHDNEYCKKVRMTTMYSRGPRLLDLIDTCIFDFLIDNGDRHHYEVFKSYNHSIVLFLDNGKR